MEGEEITPFEAAWLSISDGEIRVKGEVLMLEGDIDLLVGKDILQFLDADEDWCPSENIHRRNAGGCYNGKIGRGGRRLN